ncbi:acetoin utilization protein AcuC [Hoyosella rhizosphaerae]|uniref:Acetoin utilization protein AcuC n=1 Tax=Hoyosella rhizosphaerae TaxID=1755582 RepID=A0A916U4Q1_9ACTN|nr:acetoin utilization protein AcuC [Hoyosella rhizosphaerae]MBN4926370.1 acetoin utilization protein AcuC [Hoyosella rhizosphaerae]GGC59919.1 acetoin utilization protein AcuC [Hoyosella rhizosphaerae]
MGQSSQSSDSAVIWTPDFLRYRLSESHPMNPVRLELTMALAQTLGVLSESAWITPEICADHDITRVHTPEYVSAVKRVSNPTDAATPAGQLIARAHGLGTEDTPIFADMHHAGATITGGTLTAAKLIQSGQATRALSLAGGMHHAMPNSAAGFCIYNDCAIAIDWLLNNGYKRIAYIDVDVHHGDGVQEIFFDDPRVMTVSLHQHPATIWPGTGWAAELGRGKAEGTAVNLPLLPGTTDAQWLRAFHAVVPGAIHAFKPDVIVSQCGVDTHADDPLADLKLTVEGQNAAFLAMRDLADEVCEGRWLVTGGGGYSITRVVPRAWTHLIAAVVGTNIDFSTPMPTEWRELAQRRTGEEHPPELMGDGGTGEYTPWSGSVVGTVTGPPSLERDLARVDSAILETRRSVFPLLGLDPDDPRD